MLCDIFTVNLHSEKKIVIEFVFYGKNLLEGAFFNARCKCYVGFDVAHIEDNYA